MELRKRLIWELTVVIILLCILMVVRNIRGDVEFKSKYQRMVDSYVLIGNSYGFAGGVIIDDNIILTAAHVLQQSDIIVTLDNGSSKEVVDFYIDDVRDVGFIFIDIDEKEIVNLSESFYELGDDVFLIGSPYHNDFSKSLTKGILSHLNRTCYGKSGLLQTDAEGAPGSSGGPLFNDDGEVIGICVGGATPGGGVTLCESLENIKESYKRCIKLRGTENETNTIR